MIWQSLKWVIRLLILVPLIAGLANCTMLGLNYSSLETDNKPVPTPDLTAGFDPVEVRATLENELYGPWPTGLAVSASAPRLIDPNYLDGRGTLEEVMVTIGEGEGARTFPLVLALPNAAQTRAVPLIISQTFSDNCSVFPDHPVSDGRGGVCDGSNMTGAVGFIATNIFGTYIAYAPVERFFDAGLGYASFEGSGFIPDSNGAAQSVMASLPAQTKPTGALIAWAFGFESAAQALGQDARIDASSIAALGHSRFGKSALVAAGWSDRIHAAIAHQSGFAGGSSSRSTTGETLQRMANGYPHWLRPGLEADLKAGKDLTLDQHFLLALAAPKPIFLGNGRRDVWSDPNSSYRLAAAASLVYEANDAVGLAGNGMRDFIPEANISYWLRTGGHSVVSEDIDAFIAFMTAHFSDRSPQDSSLQSSR